MKPPHIRQSKRSPSRRNAASRRRTQAKTKRKSKGKSRARKSSRSVRAKADAEESRSFRGVFIFLLVTAAAVYGAFYLNKHPDVVKHFFQQKDASQQVPDPVKYEDLKNKLATERQMLKSRFINAPTAEEQDQIIIEAGKLLETAMPELMRCWLGHEWDFHGTATVPGEGKIACGYFVSVIMRDTGFKVNRIKLAQQPSQNIIKTFLPNKRDMWITSGLPYGEYVSSIEAKYDGVNIVGLDKHVAFIVIEDGKLRFIHSGGLQKKVVDEEQQKAHSLEVSRYRVIGNITSNKDALLKWVLGDAFDTAM